MASSLQRAKSWKQIENNNYYMFQLMHSYKWLWWRWEHWRFKLHRYNKWKTLQRDAVALYDAYGY